MYRLIKTDDLEKKIDLTSYELFINCIFFLEKQKSEKMLYVVRDRKTNKIQLSKDQCVPLRKLRSASTRCHSTLVSLTKYYGKFIP